MMYDYIIERDVTDDEVTYIARLTQFPWARTSAEDGSLQGADEWIRLLVDDLVALGDIEPPPTDFCGITQTIIYRAGVVERVDVCHHFRPVMPGTY